ncbi:MAG TPA: M56 family metallopeptidase [Steroidobacteraceae bacterium]|nr:M56 family metallopeptidase [Steroidobacteraceae bacterium]
MSYTVTLSLVLAALYGLASLLLSLLVAGGWRAGLARRRSTSPELLALRLLPSAGAAFVTLGIVLPAFLSREPHGEAERAGPLLVALALLALGAVAHGTVRGWRAWAATRALLRGCGPAHRLSVLPGGTVDLVDVAEPLAAVVGAWRPRVLAARCLRAACSDEEFREIIAHEAAHLAAHDNWKLLLVLMTPDALAWTPTDAALAQRWRAAAELEADARASGSDPSKRVALAAALIKAARLSSSAPRSGALAMQVVVDDVQGRVRRLLAPAPAAARRFPLKALIGCALMIAVLAVPLYGRVQELVESLVAWGR